MKIDIKFLYTTNKIQKPRRGKTPTTVAEGRRMK
jgi:hypothetical protein